MSKAFISKINEFYDEVTDENIKSLKFISYVPIINVIFIITIIITYFKNLDKYDQ